MKTQGQQWTSKFGVILAVAGSAVGLGNFLRFPGQAAQYGGGAFMLAYFISFLIIGLPLCWVEWTLGRLGGGLGFNAAPGIFYALSKKPFWKYVGALGVMIPILFFMYYVVVESWCLGYAVEFLFGKIHFANTAQASHFFSHFAGLTQDGSALQGSWHAILPYLAISFFLNFFLVYRGLSRGIELFCNYALPALILMGIITLIRVLTLGTPEASLPEQNISNGLGFMWNPNKVVLEQLQGKTWTVKQELVGTPAIQNAIHVVQEATAAAARTVTQQEPSSQSSSSPEQGMTLAAGEAPQALRIRTISIQEQLKKPDLWLTAAGQIFLSLSVGLGVILTYSSYVSRQDDVVLSGLTAASANEFCEVGLGGLITLPAGVAFLGIAGVAGQSTFGLGFHVLPLVFSKMPAGMFFGALFFFLLFLAAITSSISALQPGIAFLEESLNISRKQSVTLLGLMTALGAGFITYFSHDLKALDTFDFWVGTFLIFCFATLQMIFFSWFFGVDRGLKEANRGSAIHIPRFFRWVMKFLCPVFLISVFLLWLLENFFGISLSNTSTSGKGIYSQDLFGPHTNPVAWMSIGIMALFGCFVVLLISRTKAYQQPVKLLEEQAKNE